MSASVHVTSKISTPGVGGNWPVEIAPDLEEMTQALLIVGSRADADTLIHEVEALPAARPTVRAKHGVCAQHIHLQRNCV